MSTSVLTPNCLHVVKKLRAHTIEIASVDLSRLATLILPLIDSYDHLLFTPTYNNDIGDLCFVKIMNESTRSLS
jgi:hypothetical protein